MPFDPSIILAHKQYTGPDPHETMRTLSQLALQGVQKQQAEASLAGLLEQQGQARSLADIFRANADSPDQLSAALMRGGFGSQAFAAQDQQSQMGKLIQEYQEKEQKRIGELFYGVKDQDSWTQARAGVPEQFRGMIPEGFDPAAAKRLSDLALPAEKRAQLSLQAETLEETKRHHREEEKRPPGGAPGLTIITGEGGSQMFVDPRNPTKSATPIIGPDGKPVVKPSARAGGKTLPPSALSELADFDTAEEQVADLFVQARKKKIWGLDAKAGRFLTEAFGLQGTDAAQFEGSSAPVRQGVGTILEGGKLAAGDEVKYKNMLPKYGDSPAVLTEKERSLKAFLKTLKAKRVNSLKAGGYVVPGAPGAPGQRTPVASGDFDLNDPSRPPGMTDEEWAEAQAIYAKLGAEPL